MIDMVRRKYLESYPITVYIRNERERMRKESKSKTGFYQVYRHKCEHCKHGYTWVYKYYEEDKWKFIRNVDIDKLEEKVKAKGLEWRALW